MSLSNYNGGFAFDSQAFKSWIPPNLENLTLCPNEKTIEHIPSFTSDPFFCGSDQSASETQEPVQRTGLLTRLWKAFQITIGVGALDGGTAKEQWHAKAERSAAKEEPKLESSLKDLRRRLVYLEQKKLSLQVKNNATIDKSEIISDSFDTLWARHWAFTRFCDLDKPPVKWCHEGMNALNNDISKVDALMQEGKYDIFLSMLDNSTLSPYKAFFDKKDFVVSPELLLASNAQLMSESVELKGLSEVELLSMTVSLFEGTVDTPAIASMKSALQAAFELQKEVISPFKATLTTGAQLKKHLVGDPMNVRLDKATASFKEILERQLDRISNGSSDSKSILIPGGMAGTRGITARIAPYLMKIAAKTLVNHDVGTDIDVQKILKQIDSWMFTASKTAYYEIEAQPNGKYTFRVYENKPDSSESSDGKGTASVPAITVREDVEKEMLLSHPVLRTIVETQLIGDLVREIPAFSFSKVEAADAGTNEHQKAIPEQKPARKRPTDLVYKVGEAVVDAAVAMSDAVVNVYEVIIESSGVRQVNWKEGVGDLWTSVGDTVIGMGGFKQVNWKEDLIVNDLLSNLGGKPGLASKTFAPGATDMASSSAEWDSLVSVLNHFGTSHEESEKLVFAVRLALLQRFCNENSPETIGNDDKYLTILLAAKETLARRTLSLEKQGILSGNDLAAVRLVVSQAEQLVSRSKEVEALRLHKAAAFVSFTSHAPQSSFPLARLPYRIPQNDHIRASTFPLYRPIEELVHWQPTEQAWPQDLKNFSELFLKQIDEKNLAAVIDGVQLFVEKMDAVHAWKGDLGPEAAEQAIVSISEIARAYFVAHFDGKGVRYADPKSFATVLILLDLAEDLKMLLPDSHGLSGTTAIGPYFAKYLYNSDNGANGENTENLLLNGFRLYDPEWDLRFQRIASKYSKSENLLSLGIKEENFGAMGDMGLGMWRFRNATSFAWPLGFEAMRVDAKSSSGDGILEKSPISQPLFDKSLPYWSAFENRFPDIARKGTELEQIAAAYGDTSETSLPKAFYRLRELGTMARYLLKSPIINADGPVVNRESYRNEFNAVHTPKVEIPVPELLQKKFGLQSTIHVADQKIYLFSEMRGVDNELLSRYPNIFTCADGLDNCHEFASAYDPYQNQVLKNIDGSRVLRSSWVNLPFRTAFATKWYQGNKRVYGENRNVFNINNGMVSDLETQFPGGLDWKDAVRLKSILSHKSTQISSLTSFFVTHLSLFEGEGKKEWQSFLKTNLFEPGVLTDTLKSPAGGDDIIHALEHFCDKGYSYFHSRDKNEEAAYFLDISLLLSRYVEKVKQTGAIDVSHFNMLNSDKLVEMLREETAPSGTLAERSKGPLAGVLAKHLLEEYKVHSDEELEEILELTMLYYRYPATNKAEDRQRRDAIVNGMHRIAPQIKSFVADDTKRAALFQKLMKRIVPAALNTKIVSLDLEGLRYGSESRNLEIDLVEGRISMHGMGDQTLPFAVLKSPVYQKVFGNREYTVALVNPTTWEFVDDAGYACRIVNEGSDYQILRKIDGQHWSRFVSSDHFVSVTPSAINRGIASLQEIENRKSSLGSLHFINGYTHWYHDEAPAELFMLDEQTQEKCYRASLTHTATLSAFGGKDMVNAIYDLSQKKPLKLLNIYNEGSRYQWLENIEDVSHVLIWADPDTGMPKRIELPRYQRLYNTEEVENKVSSGSDEKLSFTIDGNKAFCDQIPGFYLEPKQFNNHFFRLKALLVLRNNAGDQKVILPSWMPKSQSALSLKPEFDDVRSKSITHHNYVVLEKSKDKAGFSGADIPSNLYHSLILQSQHRYSEAAEVLSRYGYKPTAYNLPERKFLHAVMGFALTKSLDEQPAALIPAMEALVLLIKDHRAHGSDVGIQSSQIKRLYRTYYKNLSQNGAEGVSQESGAIVARYLLEIENSIEGDLLEQYREAAENDPVAAHHALADYAYKKLFMADNAINQAFGAFSQKSASKADDVSPYDRIDAAPVELLVNIVEEAVRKGNAALSTGLMLKPTEVEFAKEFITLIENIPSASEKERKEIAMRCQLIQSDSKAVKALSQIIIEVTKKPDLLKGSAKPINFTANSIVVSLEFLRNKALGVAAKHSSLAKSSDNGFDINKMFNMGSNLMQNIGARFDPSKFSTAAKVMEDRQGIEQKIPEKVVFGTLLDNYQEHIVRTAHLQDLKAPDNAVHAYKSILEPFLSNDEAPRYKEESKQLIASVEAYVKGHRKEDFSILNEASRKLMLDKRETLRQNILRDEYDLVQRELEILGFFTRGFGNSEEVIKSDLKEMANGKKSRTILDIILLFTRNDLGQLQVENNLSDSELLYGKRLIANYLTIAKRKDVEKINLLPLLDKLGALNTAEFGSLKEKTILKDISSVLSTAPQVDPEAEPIIAGFEFFNRLLVRDIQFEKINELRDFFKQTLNGNTPKHLILKLEMSFGKTFLLMPIYGFCAATGDRLSMAILPKELIVDMSKELNGMVGNTYGQRLQRLDFDRKTEFSIKRLEDILQTLTDIKKDRQFLMMTSQSIRSFYLKFIETWDLYSKEYNSDSPNEVELEGYENKIQLMRKTLNLLKEADVLFDEADLILNPKQRLSFAMGSQVGMPTERLGLVTELYRVLTSESFNDKIDIDLEFLRNENSKPKKNSYTPLYYHQTVKPVLAEMMLDRLSKRVRYADEFTNFSAGFPDLSSSVEQLSDKERHIVYQFLIDNDADGQGYTFIKNMKDTSLSRVLSLLKGELNQLLPLTLDRNYAERYGFHNEGDSLAGPYSGSNAPSKGSQFTDPWEIVNYSIQAHFKRGNHTPLIDKVISFAREQALKEMEIRGCDLEQTEAFINFQKNIGARCRVGLFQENAVEKIVAHVKADPSFQLYLIETYILPDIQEFPEELAATSQVFSLIFDSTKGFTGTPWNWQTFPEGTQVSAVADTDGATLVPIFEKSANKVFEVTSKGESRIVSLFSDNPTFKDAQVYIDSGGILKGIPHEEIARTLRTIPWFANNYDAVIYFDAEGNKMVMETGAQGPVSFENCNVPMARRFTFIDQKHSTGTNILQMPDAKGVISVSKHMILRDFMQGAKRLRQLYKDQRLEIIIHEEDSPVMKEELGLTANASLKFTDVIQYLWKRQLKLVGEENFVSARHKIQAKLQRPIFQQMQDLDKDPKSIAEWFPKGRALFFQGILNDPFATYGQQTALVPKDEAISTSVERILTPSIKSLFLEEPAFKPLKIQSLDTLKAWSRSSINLDHLDDKLNVAQGSLDHETEMEVEQEVEQENEVEQEVEAEEEVEEELQIDNTRRPWEHKFYHITQLLSQLVANKRSSGIWRLPGIMTVNQNNPYKNYDPNSNEPRSAKPVQYMLICINAQDGVKEYTSMMIDTNEADQVQKIFDSGHIGNNIEWSGYNGEGVPQELTIEDPTKQGLVLYALGAGQVSHIGLGVRGDSDPALLRHIVRAKLHDGEIFYNEDEQKVLKTIIADNGIEKVEKHIAHVLRDQTKRRVAYPSSSLASIVNQIKEGIDHDKN